jgi:hypothetical protein
MTSGEKSTGHLDSRLAQKIVRAFRVAVPLLQPDLSGPFAPARAFRDRQGVARSDTRIGSAQTTLRMKATTMGHQGGRGRGTAVNRHLVRSSQDLQANAYSCAHRVDAERAKECISLLNAHSPPAETIPGPLLLPHPPTSLGP